MSYVEERLWWPIQSPNIAGKKKAKDKIKFIDLRFERCQVTGLRKARRRQEVPQIACSWDE